MNVELVRAHPNLPDREGVQTNDKCLKTQADFLIIEILVLNSPQPSLHKGGIKKKPESNDSDFLWYLLELNQGHMDFQSIALPPELRYHS